MSYETPAARLSPGAETTGFGHDASLLASITQNSLGLLGGTALTQSAAASSPTVTEFLNAANAEYVVAGVPAGMHAFTVNGKPVSYTNIAAGTAASVWVTAENQIVIAYQGTTGGEYLALDPVIAVTQIIADVGIWAGQTPAAETDSLSFAKAVISAAEAQGYSTANIFVTGHSLGGIEAEYVAQQTGLGGIAFESTGLPVDKSAGAGSNFVNVVTYGDPVGNYSSDIKGEQPFAPTYVAGGGSLPHYGNIVLVGNQANQASLTNAASTWGGLFGLEDPYTLANLLGLALDYHLPGTQAHDLGVSLNPYAAIVDGIGSQSAAVWNVQGDTIAQLISAAGSHGTLLT